MTNKVNKIKVFYQKEFNPFAKYTNDISKTHVKVYESLTNVETNQDDVFSAFNSDEYNPLSYTNKTGKVCVIDKDTLGTGAEFQEAMKQDKVECGHTSMSVGDIVAINDTYYLCKDFGWEILKQVKL
jgi:tRNA G26 N,N-dimethylase Trm1